MTSCGSVHPHLASLENSRLSAVLGRQLGCGPWFVYCSTRFIGFGAPRRTKLKNIFGRAGLPALRCDHDNSNTHINANSIAPHGQGENIDLTRHADEVVLS